MKEERGKLVLLIVIGMLAFVVMGLISCESKSGQMVERIPLEKVVIIDGITTTVDRVTRTQYKVKRVEHGVVTYISITGKAIYEAGDTIYYRVIQ